MRVVGLTGGIASGKSTVSRRLHEVHGMPIVDADQVARHVVQAGQPALDEIVGRFGTQMLTDAGDLDRPRLAAVVFADEHARQDLNAITHPRIADEMGRRIAQHADVDGTVIVDSPLLVEMGHASRYPVIVVVACSEEVQLDRLITERGMDIDEARGRIASQAPLAEKLAVATHVIWNEGTVQELEARIDEVAERLLHHARDADETSSGG